MSTVCPHCGRRQVRKGIWLSPTKARIFDLVARAGDEGISPHAINEVIGFPNQWLVRVHIQQINDRLAATDLVIRADRPLPRGYYRLLKKERRHG